MNAPLAPRLAALALSVVMTAFTLAAIDGLATGEPAWSQIAQRATPHASAVRG